MSVNNLADCKASVQSLNELLVERLSNVPNRSVELGGNGMSPTQLKQYFDGACKYLALCLNNLVDYLQESGEDLPVTDWDGETETTLREMLTALSTGEGASILKGYAGEGTQVVSTLQSIINGLHAGVSLFQSKGLLSDGSKLFDAGYIPEQPLSPASKSYVDGRVHTEILTSEGIINGRITSEIAGVAYTLPSATNMRLGGIKTDEVTLTTNGEGVLSIIGDVGGGVQAVNKTVAVENWDTVRKTAVILCSVADADKVLVGMPAPTTAENAAALASAMPIVTEIGGSFLQLTCLGEVPAVAVTLAISGVA